MIRDWELIRAILAASEAKAPSEQLRARDIEDDPELVVAHIELLHDAGYLTATFMQTTRWKSAHVVKMTYAGYDLLDTMRSDTAWSSIKKVAKARGLELTFEVVKQVGSFVTEKLLKGEIIH
jgi:hypothetical protein